MVRPRPLQAPLRIGGAAKQEARTQFGALCYRESKKSGLEILLLTSLDTGRWIIPKGWPMNGVTPADTAAQEAWEEAGVRGKVHDLCVGHYSYSKWLDEELSLAVIVAVFALKVSRVDSTYPEAGERMRKWFSPKKASQRVDEPELKGLLRGFDPKRFK